MNTSLICLSLKYLRKNYDLIVDVSKWIYFELTKVNYKELKFIRSLDKKDFEVIKTLIKFNEDMDLLSSYLFEYSFYDKIYTDIMKLLIDNGADPHVGNDQLLVRASCKDQIDIIKLFIDIGVNIHIRNNCTLRNASCYGHIDIVKLLLINGADIHADNDSALRSASLNGHFDIVKLLVDNGADIHAEDNQALRYASYANHLEIVNFLSSLN